MTPLRLQVSEQAALGRVGGLDERIAALEAALSQQAAAAAALQRQLDTQIGVNRQLMSRKEEVEWQLMAAMAKVRVVLAAAVNFAGCSGIAAAAGAEIVPFELTHGSFQQVRSPSVGA